jgi:hypothetical protein
MTKVEDDLLEFSSRRAYRRVRGDGRQPDRLQRRSGQQPGPRTTSNVEAAFAAPADRIAFEQWTATRWP